MTKEEQDSSNSSSNSATAAAAAVMTISEAAIGSATADPIEAVLERLNSKNNQTVYETIIEVKSRINIS